MKQGKGMLQQKLSLNLEVLPGQVGGHSALSCGSESKQRCVCADGEHRPAHKNPVKSPLSSFLIWKVTTQGSETLEVDSESYLLALLSRKDLDNCPQLKHLQWACSE